GLLALGYFRVGGEAYADENHAYGLAAIRKAHATVEGDMVTFDYPAKGGKQRLQSVVDPAVAEVVAALNRRRSAGPELLAYRDEGRPGRRRWVDIKSADINGWIKERTGGDFTAKDFRTWNATVLAAVGLAVSTEARS